MPTTIEIPIIEDYLNRYRVNEIRELLRETLGNVKPYQLKIKVDKIHHELDTKKPDHIRYIIICDIYWMDSLALINHTMLITNKEIRKIKLTNL